MFALIVDSGVFHLKCFKKQETKLFSDHSKLVGLVYKGADNCFHSETTKSFELMALFIQSGGIKHCLMALLTLKLCKTANIIGFTWVASFILPSGSNTYLIFFFGKKKCFQTLGPCGCWRRSSKGHDYQVTPELDQGNQRLFRPLPCP